SADLDAAAALLAPDCRWGTAEFPDGGCQSRNEILAWWGNGRRSGTRATVTEVVDGDGVLVVGLDVTSADGGGGGGGDQQRWQIMTVRDGLIVDIRGVDDRAEAMARAGLPA
ncbi:MAG TPA: nuclear transport factor 2 family protein, partial [Acidimicrobiales bacterium]|nr:nuclear transport factor 2 family protein [Acidimicrobiales bacterium]